MLSKVSGLLSLALKQCAVKSPLGARWAIAERDPRMCRISLNIDGNFAGFRYIPRKNFPILEQKLNSISQKTGAFVHAKRFLSTKTQSLP